MRTVTLFNRFLRTVPCSYLSRRFLLSHSYYCEEAWKSRLTCPILQKVDVGTYMMQIQTKLDKEGASSAIDMEVLANTLHQIHPKQLDFAVNLFQQHRKSRESLSMTSSTPTAIVRSLISIGETPRLLNIIQDKIKYGMFLDTYCSNILIDYFIKNKQYQDAAIVAYEEMFQEDFSNELTKALSWYACHLNWKNPLAQTVEEEVVEEENTEEEEEDIYVKVDYIERPYYDDHFDIPKDTMKLGKTFVMLSHGREDIVGRSYTLVGWGLYEKFQKGLDLLQSIVDSENGDVSTDALDSFRSILENVETKEPPEQEIELAVLRLRDLYPYVTQQEKEGFLSQLEVLETTLKSAQKVKDYNLEEQLLKSVQESIKKHEKVDIDEQQKQFVKWTKERRDLVGQQINHYKTLQKKQAIAHRILELQKKEEKLFYFDEQERIHLGMSRTPLKPDLDDILPEDQYVAAPMERTKGV